MGFIKGWQPHKLTGCEDDFIGRTWFDYLLIINCNARFRPLQSSTLLCYSMKKLVCEEEISA